MKNQTRSTFKWVLGGGILCIFLVFTQLLIRELIIPKEFQPYISAMIIITCCVYCIISIVKIVQYQKWEKEYMQETLEKSKEKLSPEFTTVLLNSSDDISKEKFNCQAKIDNDGKIICKINVDFTTKFDSYEKFLRYFHFDEE